MFLKSGFKHPLVGTYFMCVLKSKFGTQNKTLEQLNKNGKEN